VAADLAVEAVEDLAEAAVDEGKCGVTRNELKKVSGFSVQVSALTPDTRPPATEFLMEEQMKLQNRGNDKYTWQRIHLIFGAVFAVFIGLAANCFAATAQQKSFASAAEAVKAAVAAAKSNDDKELLAIFGAQAKELISSGDPVADKQRRAEFLKAYDEKNSLVTEGDNTILVIGNNAWPFPIPLVKKGESWVFDTAKGKEEILNRRIGENELYTIQVLLAIVDAQREYAIKDRDGDGLNEYAQKMLSDPGKKNGLYWEAKPGEEQSPIGPLAARAMKEGYKGAQGGGPAPFHGYYYKILTAQGSNAPGGAYSYLVKGKMIGGFGVVAYPATYGNSGVVTFIVNHDGVAYQKNLGSNTTQAAQAMTKFDPDKSWTKVENTAKP
jgi:hypothetical protein